MNFFTPQQIAEVWKITPQLVRRYCAEGRIKAAFQYEGKWLIPEGTPKPGAAVEGESDQSPLLKKIMYQLERNNHYGIYEYIQVNLAYSSCRMASNRLTRNQTEEIYRTNKIATAFEPTKIDDIIEIINHFACLKYAIENVASPLTMSFIQHIHHLLTYGTYSDRKHKFSTGVLREERHKLGIPPREIEGALVRLLQEYESDAVFLEQIVDFHVRFEKIHPFADYNGRVGRILMVKECLRYGIDPFIIDDKRRGEYNRGIAQWDTNQEVLETVVSEAQGRFRNKLDTLRLIQYHRTPQKTTQKTKGRGGSR